MSDKKTEDQAVQTTETSDAQETVFAHLRDNDDAIGGDLAQLIEWLKRPEAVVSKKLSETIDGLISEIDARISRQMDEVLHNENFQELESAWTGLEYLLSKTKSSDELRVEVLEMSKDELAETLDDYSGATTYSQSPIYQNLVNRKLMMFEGQPVGAIVADYQFDHSPKDVQTLSELGRIAAIAHAPAITTAGVSLFGVDKWSDVEAIEDVKDKFTDVEYAAWNSLRDSETSRYLGVALPRMIGRLPYSLDKSKAFAYEENVGPGDESKYLWLNAGYAMAANITQAFGDWGWCAQITGPEGGGRVDNLPLHTFESAGETVPMVPTDLAIPMPLDQDLSDLGLMPMVWGKDKDYAAFFSGQSLYRPKEVRGDDAATANERLASCFPHLLSVSRFAHYLYAMNRRICGRVSDAADLQNRMHRWLMTYVNSNPDPKNQELLALQPLQAASVTVTDDPRRPGYYKADFRITPHYQLQSVDIALNLVALPTKSVVGS